MKSIIVRIALIVLFPIVSLCPAEEPPKKVGKRYENNQKPGEDGGVLNVFQSDRNDDGVIFLGNTGRKGGAVKALQATLKFNDSRFEKNTALEGGALNFQEAIGILFDGTFTQNSARTGGVLFNEQGKVVLSDSSFSGNAVGDDGDGGGVLYNQKGLVVLRNADFTDNNAAMTSSMIGGGAIVNNQGNIILVDTDFEKNQAGKGGSISNYQGVVIADRTTFDSNIALKAGGGAIENFQGTLVLRDCDFMDNAAPTGQGAAIHLFQANATLEIRGGFRTLFAGNLDQSGANSIHLESDADLKIRTDKDGVLDMRDPISACNSSGNISVTKQGNGTWKLGGVNRFTGPADVRIDEGTLYLYQSGEVGNANPKDSNAVVQAGQIILEDENSTLAFRKGFLELGSGNIIQAGKIVFGNKSGIRFSSRPNQEAEPDTLRLRGNVVFDGPTLHLRCYDKNRCEVIHIDGEAVSVKFECIEISGAKPGVYAILRAEQGIKNVTPRGVCVRAPGFKANYEIVDDNKQLNLILTEERPAGQSVERVVQEKRRRGKR